MNLIIESLILCALITIYLAIRLKKGAINWIFLYEPEVQNKAISLGLTTTEKIKKDKTAGALILFVIMAICIAISIGIINQPLSAYEGFYQFLIILEIYNIYDGIIIDELWVMHTNQWIIEGTEEFKSRYITNTKRAKRICITILLLIVIILLNNH